MNNPLDYIVDKRLRIKRWLSLAVLLSMGATLLTYYAIGVINEQDAFAMFFEINGNQDWLMNILGMEYWLLFRMVAYGIALLGIKYFPTGLYERNETFRYAANVSIILLIIGFTMDFINDSYMLMEYLLLL
jgi:hypothetical protein